MNKDSSLLGTSKDIKNLPTPNLPRPCTQEEFNEAYNFQMKNSSSVYQSLKRHYSTCTVWATFLQFFPVLQWLPQYEFKKYITSDLASGFTVAVIHIPQGMAYATLSNVHPIVGIYMAIFPIIVYFLMGTSRHISLGSFSVVCMMAAKPVLEFTKSTDSKAKIYTPNQVASVVCLTVGVIQVLLGFCKVGSLSMFFSDSLISGFTSGAAVLVLLSQLPEAFGTKEHLHKDSTYTQHPGIFNAWYTTSTLVKHIFKTNYISLLMFLCASTFLFAYSIFVKPKLKGRLFIPIELILMIISTIISYYLNLNKHYSVNIIGSIPVGMVIPSIPPMELFPKIFIDSLTIAVVSFAINISMATILARKDNYKIDPNQELLASGFGNIFGGFFSCLPIATSLSRSMLQYSSGGKTQTASIFSSIILLAVILYFGKFLEPLPYCVLSGIVIVCLQKVLLQIKDFPGIWRQSTIDGVIWLSTFLSVVLLEIHIGLIVALVMALLSIVLRNQNMHICLLGRVPNTDIYLETDKYPLAQPVPNFIIVQIYAGLHFANIRIAKNRIEYLINEAIQRDSLKPNTLLIDMSGVAFVDPNALQEIQILVEDLKRVQINVCFTQCSSHVFEQMNKCRFLDKFSGKTLFPSIQDAVSSISKDSENK